MSHRKVYSQGSIPFAWEDMPGVSKIVPSDLGLHALNLSSPSPKPSLHDSDTSTKIMVQDIKIPLPPCPKMEPPRRSTSSKGFRWLQEDPFLAAYKECTKNVRQGQLPGESNKSAVSKVRKSKHIFSCKKSCDVQEDNLVRLANLPPIPRVRVGRR